MYRLFYIENADVFFPFNYVMETDDFSHIFYWSKQILRRIDHEAANRFYLLCKLFYNDFSFVISW